MRLFLASSFLIRLAVKVRSSYRNDAVITAITVHASDLSLSTMVAGKIVVSGVPRLPQRTRYPANNNFAEYNNLNVETNAREVSARGAQLVGPSLWGPAFGARSRPLPLT